MAAEAERVAQVTAEAEAAARLQEEQKVAAAKAAAEEKEQAREKKRAEEPRVVLHMPQVLAWRLMIDRLEPTTQILQSWCKAQNADLQPAEQKPFPKEDEGKSMYKEALMRHLLLTMHKVGFVDLQLLGDKDAAASHTYSMLWREAVFRGIPPVENSARLHASMFDEPKNGLELLPRMQRVEHVPDLQVQLGRRGASGANGSKRRFKRRMEDDFNLLGENAKTEQNAIMKRAVSEALVVNAKVAATEEAKKVKKALIVAKAANPNPNPNPNANHDANPNPDPNPNPNPNPNRKHTH